MVCTVESLLYTCKHSTLTHYMHAINTITGSYVKGVGGEERRVNVDEGLSAAIGRSAIIVLMSPCGVRARPIVPAAAAGATAVTAVEATADGVGV